MTKLSERRRKLPLQLTFILFHNKVIPHFSGTAYVVFALACWISPSVVVITGPRLSMVVASLAYAFQISQYLYLNTISVYVASVLIGIGAPILWTAQVRNFKRFLT